MEQGGGGGGNRSVSRGGASAAGAVVGLSEERVGDADVARPLIRN